MTRAPITHPWWLRLTHWINAIAVVILIMSGWQIYNAAPLFDFRFPREITLGGWLAGALNWHFAAMWLLFFNGLFYLVINVVTGRFRHKFGSLRWRDLSGDVRAALRLKLVHQDLASYNAIQKLAYIVAIISLIMLVLTGLVLWKPVQFPVLRTLLGDYEVARYLHFGFMAVICAFIVVHVLMALLVPRTIKGMVTGRV